MLKKLNIQVIFIDNEAINEQELKMNFKFKNFRNIFNFLFFFFFLGSHPQHMEVPRLGVKSELQVPA